MNEITKRIFLPIRIPLPVLESLPDEYDFTASGDVTRISFVRDSIVVGNVSAFVVPQGIRVEAWYFEHAENLYTDLIDIIKGKEND